MLKLSRVSVPASTSTNPVVRLLRGAAAVVGKRRTNRGSHFFSVHRSLSITPELPRELAPANNYCIALLSEVSVDDAIIVSALTTAPFCCHADLLTMSAPQLTAVARVLNESLPPSLRINAEPGCPPGQIRLEIEAVVGLRSPSSSVQPLSQAQSEYPASYHCLDGDRLPKDMNYDGNIGIICEPTSHAPSSPGVKWSRTALSISDTDVGTPPSFVMRSRHRLRKNQVLSRLTSTPIDEAPDTLLFADRG